MADLISSQRICYVAGKSGGHIIPCITRATAIKQRYPHFKIDFFSTDSVLDMKILQNAPLLTKHIPLRLGNFPRLRLHKYPLFIFQFIRAFFMSFFHLRKTRPGQVISTGGYVAIPVCFAAWLLRIPIELQVLDVIPGMAITFLARFAQVISVCFDESKKFLPVGKCITVNYPVRFSKQDACLSKQEARKKIPILKADRLTVFVLGGSQGSIFLNNLFKEYITGNPALHTKIQVIHQTGVNDATDWPAFYASYKIPAHIFTYSDQMNICYQAADIVLTRAGAGTLFEIDFFQLPAIIIPLISATTAHQKDNAFAFAKRSPERCTVIEQEDMAHTKMKLEKVIGKSLS